MTVNAYENHKLVTLATSKKVPQVLVKLEPELETLI